MKKRQASSTVFIIAFFVAFLALTAFGVDGAIIYTQRAKLQSATEAAALAGASEFNYSSSATSDNIKTAVATAAKSTFNLLKVDSLDALNVGNSNDYNSTADFDIKINTASKQVKITTNYVAQPYFLAFLGVTGIKLQAVACAKSEPLNVEALYNSIDWITSAGQYFSSIISKDKDLHDTAILPPLGNFMSASIDPTTGWVMYDAIDKDIPVRGPDEAIPAGSIVPLSLGPGGFITIRLPAPIIDKEGADLYIKEVGNAVEGYFVFAGLDNDTGEPSATTGPYVNVDKPGKGISWIDISCSAKSELTDTNSSFKPYSVPTLGLQNKTKFYGSAYYDLGASCITNDPANTISMAKYIRIVDDNSESAFVAYPAGSNTYYKTMLYGEASTDTAGADIDTVQVLNHVRLIPPSTYVP